MRNGKLKCVCLPYRILGVALLAGTLTLAGHASYRRVDPAIEGASAFAGWYVATHVFDGNEAGSAFFTGAGAAAGAYATSAAGRKIGGLIGGPVGVIVGSGLGAL